MLRNDTALPAQMNELANHALTELTHGSFSRPHAINEFVMTEIADALVDRAADHLDNVICQQLVSRPMVRKRNHLAIILFGRIETNIGCRTVLVGLRQSN